MLYRSLELGTVGRVIDGYFPIQLQKSDQLDLAK